MPVLSEVPEILHATVNRRALLGAVIAGAVAIGADLVLSGCSSGQPQTETSPSPSANWQRRTAGLYLPSQLEDQAYNEFDKAPVYFNRVFVSSAAPDLKGGMANTQSTLRFRETIQNLTNNPSDIEIFFSIGGYGDSPLDRETLEQSW